MSEVVLNMLEENEDTVEGIKQRKRERERESKAANVTMENELTKIIFAKIVKK